MLNAGLLQVTGRGTNVNFTIDDRAAFESVVAGLETCLVENRHLFSKGNITVNVGRRILAREQLTEIKRILEDESGLRVVQFWCSPEVLEEVISGPGSFPTEEPHPGDDQVRTEGLVQIDPVPTPSPISMEGLPEYRPDSVIPSARLNLDVGEELDEDSDPPGQTRPWRTPEFAVMPEPDLSAPAFSRENNAVSMEAALPHPEDSQDSVPQPLLEAANTDESQGLVEPASQKTTESIGARLAAPVIEPLVEPIVEPSLLELSLLGLEQSIAEGGLESGQDGSSAPPASLPKALEAEPDPEGVGRNVTAAGEYISSHPEIIGLDRQNEALLIKTTCRSGEVVRYPGDVVILADVNPGAEIIADGDILVFGSLRGLAHAGAGGDIQATIIALNLETSRIQIGPFIGMAPKAKKRTKSNRPVPTLAFVRRQHIYVAPFKGRFAGYTGGTIYDG